MDRFLVLNVFFPLSSLLLLYNLLHELLLLHVGLEALLVLRQEEEEQLGLSPDFMTLIFREFEHYHNYFLCPADSRERFSASPAIASWSFFCPPRQARLPNSGRAASRI
jgi:hypothetical protein